VSKSVLEGKVRVDRGPTIMYGNGMYRITVGDKIKQVEDDSVVKVADDHRRAKGKPRVCASQVNPAVGV